MAERHRSEDGRRETEELLGRAPEDMDPVTGEQGRKGGEMQRKVGTRDELKQVDETSAGRTTPKAQDQDGSGDKEKV